MPSNYWYIRYTDLKCIINTEIHWNFCFWLLTLSTQAFLIVNHIYCRHASMHLLLESAYTVFATTTGFKKAAFSSNAKSPSISILSSWSWCIEASRRTAWMLAKSPPDPMVHQKIVASKYIKINALKMPIAIVAVFCGIDTPKRTVRNVFQHNLEDR